MKNIQEYRDLKEFICDSYSLEEIKIISEDWTTWAWEGNHPGLRRIWEEMHDEIQERYCPFRGSEDPESIFATWVQILGVVIQDLCEKIAYEKEEENEKV